MDSNQSEQQYYLSKLSSNIISPAQYPCTVIGSNKNNIHTIVPNISSSSLSNNNVKYQNSTDSKIAQNLSYNCYSNMANCSFNIANQNEDIKILFGGSKPKKIHNKRVKVVNHCLHSDNGSDITAAPNQLTILVQKVLPAQVPDHHISAQPLSTSVISASVAEPAIAVDNDTISTVINEVLAKATSNDAHDDVFLSVIKSHCDPLSPQENNRPPGSPQFDEDHQTTTAANKRRHSSTTKTTSIVKRQKMVESELQTPSHQQQQTPHSHQHHQQHQHQQISQPPPPQPYQPRCQLSAPVFRKLVHEPPLTGAGGGPVLPPLGVSVRGRPCVDRRQLQHNCVKYRRPPFSLQLPRQRPRRRRRRGHHDDQVDPDDRNDFPNDDPDEDYLDDYPDDDDLDDDQFIVQNLNANLPASALLSAGTVASDDLVDCSVVAASPPGRGDLDYLSVFLARPAAPPGPALEMLAPAARAPSPQMALFHCPNRDYLVASAALAAASAAVLVPPAPRSSGSSTAVKCASTPTSTDTSVVDSETGEAVCRDLSLPSSSSVAATTAVTASSSVAATGAATELPLYSEQAYKSSSLFLWWRRRQRLCSRPDDEDDDREEAGEDPVLVQGAGRRVRLLGRPARAAPSRQARYQTFRPSLATATSTTVVKEDEDDRLSPGQFVRLSQERGLVMTSSSTGTIDLRRCCQCWERGDRREDDRGRLLYLGGHWAHARCPPPDGGPQGCQETACGLEAPFRVGSLSVLRLGWAFRARRLHWSSRLSGRRGAYLCELLPGDGDNAHIYSVTAIDNGLPNRSECAPDPATAWRPFLEQIAALHASRLPPMRPQLIDCPRLFGVDEPAVVAAVAASASGCARTEPIGARRQAYPHLRLPAGSQRRVLTTSTPPLTTVTVQKWQRLQADIVSNTVVLEGGSMVAGRDLERGAAVCEHLGEVVRPSVAALRARRYRREGLGGGRLLPLDHDWVLDGTRRGGLSRYVVLVSSAAGDGLQGNCLPEVVAVNGEARPRLLLVASRRIERGERLSCSCDTVSIAVSLSAF